MRRIVEFILALVLFALLSSAGTFIATRLALTLPGPVLAMLVYILMLSLGFMDWTIAAARWLGGLLGALIVPALVSIALFAGEVEAGGWRLAVALVAGTIITALATAMAFRLAGGRR